MNVAETSRPMGESERRLRAALADTHLETPRSMVSLAGPELLGKLFDARLLASLRPASVLLPLIRRGEQLSMLLTVRSANLRNHGGQIAFPGGARDAGDITAVDNALREAQEEVGLDPALVEVIGYLDDYPTLSRYRITPVVGLIHDEPQLSIHDGEVAEIFELPFERLLDRANFERTIASREGIEVPIFELHWQQYRIWGATAGMLWELAVRMESA